MISRDEQASLRKGRITGSIAQRIMTSSRSAWDTIAKDLREPKPFYSLEDTPNMPEALAWGQRHERQAVGHFWERHPELDVHDPRFLHWHDPANVHYVRHFGYSPDRMLSMAGFDTFCAGLEAKCPYDGAVHVETIKNRWLPLTYKWQVYMGLYVSDLPEWWFVTFDPRVQDAEWRYYELRVIPRRADLEKLASTLREFLDGYTMGESFGHGSATAEDYSRWF